jgi:hypothetical protein
MLLFSPSESKATAPILDSAFLSEEAQLLENGTDTKKDGKEVEITSKFFFSLAFDLLTIALIIIFIYYPNYKKLDTIFTFVMFNVTIFLLTYVLNTVKISMGAAFGLFAVFSMLRYRTSGIDMKDMTYLFIFIAMGLISAIEMDFYENVIISCMVIGFTLILDTKLILKRESSKTIRYEKIEMIKPEQREELIKELKERTGLNIHRVSIAEIDFLKDVAMINIYYYD